MLASYSNKKRELDAALANLDESLEQTVEIMDQTLPRLRNNMIRLIENVKQWILDWTEQYSNGSSSLLDDFGTSTQQLAGAIWLTQQQIATVFLEFERQKRLFIDYNLKPNLKWKRIVFRYKTEAFVIVESASGLLWVLQKFFCTLRGLGNGFASFVTSEVAESFVWFYQNVLEPYFVGPLRSFFQLLSPSYVLGKIQTFFVEGFNNLKEEILSFFFGGWIDQIRDAIDAIADAISGFVCGLFGC